MTRLQRTFAAYIQNPLQEFFRLEAAGGITLMAAMVLALLVANSPLREIYEGLLSLPVALQIGSFKIAKPLLLWINDGLMALFFFLVGLELKREVVQGHLSSVDQVVLPALAAVGGMAFPAAIYVLLNHGDRQALQGWAIPTATDIAFALGVLSLLGRRIPPALKVFLLSVAIFDDLGAIVIIALFYTAHLSFVALGIFALLVGVLWTMNRLGIRRAAPYFVVGVPLWVALLKSGVHATLAGVVLALFIPLGRPEEESLLHRLEHGLHPWVAFGVLPIFAFANAGVSLSGLHWADLMHPVPLGIALGLFVGKQLGILTAVSLAVGSRRASLPQGVRWIHLYGVSLLCGIGFTMSLFIASLAFEEGSGAAYFGLERLGILVGSLLSGVLGYGVLSRAPAGVGERDTAR